MQHLSEKTQFPSFLFPQVVPKHYLGACDCVLSR